MILTASGADYLLALKENQPTLYRLAQEKLEHLPDAWTSRTDVDHGRAEWRELRVSPFDLDTALFPGARQLVSISVKGSKEQVRQRKIAHLLKQCSPASLPEGSELASMMNKFQFLLGTLWNRPPNWAI